MRVDDFNALDVSRRLDILWEWAFFLANKKTEKHVIAYFSHSGFYIELVMEVKSHMTVSVTGLTHEELIKKFPEIFSTQKAGNLFFNPVW